LLHLVILAFLPVEQFPDPFQLLVGIRIGLSFLVLSKLLLRSVTILATAYMCSKYGVWYTPRVVLKALAFANELNLQTLIFVLFL